MSEVARSGPPRAVLMPSAPASARDAEITEMKDRYAMGDFTGALVVAEHARSERGRLDAQRYAQSCRDVLTQMYTARLGALTPARARRGARATRSAGFRSITARASCCR